MDQKLPFGFVGTVEFLFNKNLNAVHYYNANLKGAVSQFTGADNRLRFGGSDATVRINNNVSNAIVLANKNKGDYKSMTVKLEMPYRKGLWGHYRDWETDRKSTRLNSSHLKLSRMPSSA